MDTVSIANPSGLTDSIRALKEVASESVLRQATVAAARVIHAEIRLRAPVGTVSWERGKQRRYPGFLRDHIVIAYDGNYSVPGRMVSYVITWTKDAFYGYFVEYGTSKMAAQPFLRPGYDAKKDEAVNKFDDVIQQKVKELTYGK